MGAGMEQQELKIMVISLFVIELVIKIVIKRIILHCVGTHLTFGVESRHTRQMTGGSGFRFA